MFFQQDKNVKEVLKHSLQQIISEIRLKLLEQRFKQKKLLYLLLNFRSFKTQN